METGERRSASTFSAGIAKAGIVEFANIFDFGYLVALPGFGMARNKNSVVTQFGGFVDPLIQLGDWPDLSVEAHLADEYCFVRQGLVFQAGDDGSQDGKIEAGV